MNTSKIVGFLQGMLYPLLFFVINYLVQNLGASGIFSVGTAAIITGMLSILENAIQDKTGKALFGIAR